MNNFFARYYLDLQRTISEKVPLIKWIEQDFGQESNSKLRPSVSFPAALIDFPDTTYENIALGGLTATVEVRVRLLVAVYSQSYETAPDGAKQDAMQYFELEHCLTKTLHGWQPDDGYAQPLMLSGVSTSNNNTNGLRIRTLRFSTSYEEYEEMGGEFNIVVTK